MVLYVDDFLPGGFLNLGTVLWPEREVVELQGEVRELDALLFTTVRGESGGGLRILPAFHPPDDVTGQEGFPSVGRPEVAALLSFPEVEDVVSFDLYSANHLRQKVVRVSGLVGREGPFVRNLECWRLLWCCWFSLVFVVGYVETEDLLQESDECS